MQALSPRLRDGRRRAVVVLCPQRDRQAATTGTTAALLDVSLLIGCALTVTHLLLNEVVAPREDAVVISKEHPNAFRETPLASVLSGAGVEHLVVVGMMTSMCVDATVRAAVDEGFEVTVVADACAAPDLQCGDRRVAAADVQAAFLAALDGTYATVVSAETFLTPPGSASP